VVVVEALDHADEVVGPAQRAGARRHVDGQRVVGGLPLPAQLPGAVAETFSLLEQRVVPLLPDRPLAGGLVDQRHDVLAEALVRRRGLRTGLAHQGGGSRVVELAGDRPGVGGPRADLAQGPSEQGRMGERRVEVGHALLQERGRSPQPGGDRGRQVGLGSQPGGEQHEHRGQGRSGVVVRAAPPVGPVAHQDPAAQHHQGEVTVDPLVVAQCAVVQAGQPGDPRILAALGRLDALGRQVRQRLVVLREPEDAAESRVGCALVGDELRDELVERSVARRDRHDPAR
jgi:hypothetical protein